jgi:hypothetical protein
MKFAPSTVSMESDVTGSRSEYSVNEFHEFAMDGCQAGTTTNHLRGQFV